MRTHCRCALCATTILALSAVVRADLIALTQTRTLDTSASASSFSGPSDSNSDHAEALDFGLFSESIASSANDGVGDTATANASQSSIITGSGFSASGSVSVQAAGGDDFSQASASAESRFELSFELTAPGTISGQLHGCFFGSPSGDRGFTRLEISGIGTIVGCTVTGFPQPNISVDLPAGTYDLTLFSTASYTSVNFSGSNAASFNIQLVPEPSSALLLLALGGLMLRRRR